MRNLLNRRITFGGDVIPAYVASVPNIVKPTRKMTVVQIPGTNREVVEMEDAWESYDQVYRMFVGDGTYDQVHDLISDVAEKLYKTGWQELLDDYDPDYFRLAYYQGPFDIENRRTAVGIFEISFKCRPEKFLITGNTEVTVASGGIINNPTEFKSKPLIYIEGTGNGTVTVGGKTMTFTGIVDYLYIDCDRMDVYRLPTENRNSLMSGDFPVLNPGDNTVSFTGGITTVKITPRTWTL